MINFINNWTDLSTLICSGLFADNLRCYDDAKTRPSDIVKNGNISTDRFVSIDIRDPINMTNLKLVKITNLK